MLNALKYLYDFFIENIKYNKINFQKNVTLCIIIYKNCTYYFVCQIFIIAKKKNKFIILYNEKDGDVMNI